MSVITSAEQQTLLLSFGFAKRYQILLLANETGWQARITAETPLSAITEAQRCCPEPIHLQACSQDEFDDALAAAYQQNSQASRELMEQIGDEVSVFQLVEQLPDADLLDGDDDAPIIKLINALIAEAIKENASDIHIEPYERSLSVRLRIDGVLREIISPKPQLAALLCSRIKVMAKLDIAEKRVPQDGRINVRIAGRGLDIRVSTLPSSHGERIVMRLLDKKASRLGLAQLGMPESTKVRFQKALLRPNGIILVTGPTGSGKTTTLYAGINLLNERSRNILTVEDPIEYAVDGVGQTQVNLKTGMTFVRGLRAMLRQDPDVMMVGEIRDRETAEIAIQASLTGHMVLSTLHTNDAVGAITRLKDIGIDAYLIATSVRAVLAQRLLRRLCEQCRQQQPVNETERTRLDVAQGTLIYHPQGCQHCSNTGYRGRIGVYELLEIDDLIAEQIHRNESEFALRSLAHKRMPALGEEARARVLDGSTSLEELLRILQAD